ncbi:hypothetical protein DAEQUDRAFT_720689 [Daedalea quercina L-15889]|uniref:Uncharacterized protein n=1 Tax=Daedalea quercina L-15889 TaxID=1314783 RepID=A0A165U7I8_9APHY|nr:hypothetical protein DAEQUDRAFT_720689 [Daedalea quercina L-15889]
MLRIRVLVLHPCKPCTARSRRESILMHPAFENRDFRYRRRDSSLLGSLTLNRGNVSAYGRQSNTYPQVAMHAPR